MQWRPYHPQSVKYTPSGSLQEQFADSFSKASLDLQDDITQVAELSVPQPTYNAELSALGITCNWQPSKSHDKWVRAIFLIMGCVLPKIQKCASTKHCASFLVAESSSILPCTVSLSFMKGRPFALASHQLNKVCRVFTSSCLPHSQQQKKNKEIFHGIFK